MPVYLTAESSTGCKCFFGPLILNQQVVTESIPGSTFY